MKKVIFYAVLVLATLVMIWQQATIRNLIDRVYTDNEDYFLDVLTESDDYQNYCESLDRL